MDVELIFKISTVGIIVAIVNLVLSKLGRDEYSTLTTLAGVLVVLLVLLDKINELFDLIRAVFELK